MNCFDPFNHFRGSVQHQPSDVREKESTRGIVRVAVGITVFVMQSMISDPSVQTALRSEFSVLYQAKNRNKYTLNTIY